MISLVATPELVRQFNSVIKDKVDVVFEEKYTIWCVLDHDKLEMIGFDEEFKEIQFRVRYDLLMNSAENFTVVKPLNPTDDQLARWYKSIDVIRSESEDAENSILRQSKIDKLMPHLLRTIVDQKITGDEIIKGVQALGFDLTGWKIFRNHVTNGYHFHKKTSSIGDGQEKIATYTPVSFEAFVTDLRGH